MTIRTLWYLLTSYSSALTALASLVGAVLTFLAVVVATVYARLTSRLAQAAKAQAIAAKDQAEASVKQADASRVGAEAAADQARSTRLIFEAAHRPYLEVRLDPSSFYIGPDLYRLDVTVKNHGPVPAILDRWQAVIRKAREKVAGIGPELLERCVFPDVEVPLQMASHPMAFTPGLPPGEVTEVGVEIDVTYRGFHAAPYRTYVSLTGSHGQWHVVVQQME